MGFTKQMLLALVVCMVGVWSDPAGAQTDATQNQLLNSNGVTQNLAREQLIELQQQIFLHLEQKLFQ